MSAFGGAKRTLGDPRRMTAFDPKRTFGWRQKWLNLLIVWVTKYCSATSVRGIEQLLCVSGCKSKCLLRDINTP